MKPKFIVNEDSILKCLSHLELPSHYHYEVEQFSKLIHRVWLVDTRKYDYTTDDVRTIHCFVKSDGSVMKPKNSDKTSSTRVCHLSNIPERMNLTVLEPAYTTLLSLFD
jgi:hypothetical protein